MIRIATRKDNGRKYSIVFLDFDRKIVRVHGEVEKTNGTTTYHADGFNMDLESITISRIVKTEKLCEELFLQGIAVGEENGDFKVSGITGGKIKKYHITKA